MKGKTVIKCALKIAKHTFNEREVRVTRSMHVETDLLDSIGNFRTSESGVLKSTGKTTI
jgi:hypothetical protein